MEEQARFQRRFNRERAARKEAERLAEKKTRELYLANQQLTQFTNHLEELVALRTAELEQSNQLLKAEVAVRQEADEQLHLLYEESQANLARMEALHEASQLLMRADSLTSVLQAVVDGTVAAVQADRVQLFGLDMDAQTVTYTVRGGPGARQTDDLTYQQLTQGLSGWVIVNREPAVSPKGASDPRESKRIQAARRKNQAGSIVVVPLIHRDRLLGTLTAVNRPNEEDFSPQDIDLMVAMASQAATAIADVELLEKMEAARLAAESASQAKSRFLANMSHELRTPLNGILGYAQILARDRALSAKQQEAVEIIHRSGEHLLTLINDILDLSKIEAERMELAPSTLQLGDFLKIIAGIISVRAEHKAIDFHFRSLSRLPTAVIADESRLRQVLLNLLGNAVKFTHEGGVTFNVGHHHGRIRFEIIDSGVGIASTNLPEIFEPFRQTGDRQLQVDGAGLGLAISNRLVKLMGGELRVESTLGQGSRFWFDLELPEVESRFTPQATETHDVVGFQGGACRVLLADDRAENRTVLRDLLLPLGFDILEVVNGQEAIDATPDFQPHLILMDLVMPVVDGFSAISTIRNMSLGYRPAIIAVSASVFEIDLDQCIAVGCDDFIVKPVDFERLLQAIDAQTHISWIYEAGDPLPSGEDRTRKLIPPPPEQLHALQQLVRIGDIDGLQAQISAIRKLDAGYGAFASAIESLSAEFQFEAIEALLDQYLGREQ